MILLAIICQLVPHALVGIFSKDPAVIKVGVDYLRIVSISFIASGLIFVASSMVQAMGNTMPSLISSGTRILLIAIPAIILSHQPGFQLIWVWWLSAASIIVQLILSMLLLRREFRRKLNFAVPEAPVIAANAQMPLDQTAGVTQAT